MVDSADGPDEAIKLCVTKLTRSSLGETGDDLAASLENVFRREPRRFLANAR
jgi:hypothetical protein